MESTGSVIVSWDFTNGKDINVLLVGKREPGETVEIINAFQGEEAEQLLKKLTSQESRKER